MYNCSLYNLVLMIKTIKICIKLKAWASLEPLHTITFKMSSVKNVNFSFGFGI